MSKAERKFWIDNRLATRQQDQHTRKEKGEDIKTDEGQQYWDMWFYLVLSCHASLAVSYVVFVLS
jgi:hypothetical protein